MKNLFFILFLLYILLVTRSCNKDNKTISYTKTDTTQLINIEKKYDSVLFLKDSISKININLENKILKCSILSDSFKNQKKYSAKFTDSLIRKNKQLKDELFLANFKVEKVKTYIKIVERKPSQRVFLLGWVRRAVKD